MVTWGPVVNDEAVLHLARYISYVPALAVPLPVTVVPLSLIAKPLIDVIVPAILKLVVPAAEENTPGSGNSIFLLVLFQTGTFKSPA